jgi:hypothetical protein
MNAAITFPENTAGTKTAGSGGKFRAVKLISGFEHFIEEGDWDERLMGYEKYIDRFSRGAIIVSAVFFIPVFISIFSR